MSNEERHIYRELENHEERLEALERLTRTAPAGSRPPSCWEARGAGREQDATDFADSSRVGRTEGRVPLVQLQLDLMSEAVELERFSHDSVAFTPIQLEDFAQRAAGKRAQLAALAELLGAPRPKSDGEQRCPTCNGKGSFWAVGMKYSGVVDCPKCKGTGVSGACPPNR